jgi:hypothetical protein
VIHIHRCGSIQIINFNTMSDSLMLRSPPPSSNSHSEIPVPDSLIWSFFREAQDGEPAYTTELSKGKSRSNVFCTSSALEAKQHLLEKHDIDVDASTHAF